MTHGNAAINCYGGALTMTDCTLRDNSGGAILIGDNSNVTLERCTFSGNSAPIGGAIFVGNFCTTTLRQCTLVGNTASQESGAIAILGVSAPTLITHCTVVGNSAPSGGGVVLAISATATLDNCIVAGNSGRGGDVYNFGTLTVTGANIFQSGVSGNAAIGGGSVSTVDPQLSPLGNYGGPTQTMPPMSGSPAIDAAVGSTFTIDQRGKPRPIDGDLSGTAIADIGAVEFVSSNADLASLALSVGTLTPAFAAATTSYTTHVSNDTATLTLTPTTAFAAATVTVNGTPVVSGNATADLALNVGANVITTVVTAQDGTKKTYTLTAIRNTPPTAPNGTATATTGDQKTITLPFPATDADGDTVTLTDTTPDAHLTVNSTDGADVTFTPTANYAGEATLGYTVSDGNGGSASGTITITISDNDAPVLNPHANVSVLATELAGVVVNFAAATATDNVTGSPTITYSQDPGTVFPLGTTTVTVNATDAAGNSATPRTFDVIVHLAAPVSTVLSATGEPVPGQGVGGIPAGAKFGTFFTPALSDLRDVAVRVTVQSGTKRLNAIYQEDDGGAGKIVALQGATGPTAPGPIGLTATWKSFSDPVLAPNGTIAFLGKISGKGVTTTGDEALWSNVLTPQLVPLLQEGVEVENINGGGTKVKKIISISARDHEIIALVKLGGAAKSLDSTALLRLVLNGNSAYYYTATPLLRTGYTPAGLGAKVLGISAFMPMLGSAGQGRTHADGGIAARVKTDTKGDVLVFVDDDGTVHPLLSTVGVGAGLSAQATKLSLPATAGSGVAAKITAKFPSSTKPTDAIVFSTTISPFTHSLAVGGTIPAGGATFTKLSDPVVNDTPSAVFLATISTKQTALYEWASDYTQREIVRSGAPATDANGAMIADTTFKAFTNYALPDGNGVVFIATLAGKAVKPTTAQGLWAEDDAHKLRLLLRTGQTVNGKTLKAFKLLDALPGSFGSRRSYNAAKSVAVLATFTDKTSAIITTEVP